MTHSEFYERAANILHPSVRPQNGTDRIVEAILLLALVVVDGQQQRGTQVDVRA